MTRLTAAEAETACYHPANLLPVRTFVGLRLCELVVHGWDIRSPLEPTAALSPESAAVLEEWWPEFVTWGFQPDTSLVTGGRFRFVFTGNGLPPYDLIVDGETVRMAPAAQGLAHVTHLTVRGRDLCVADVRTTAVRHPHDRGPYGA
jgi:hypothetical protein